MESNNTEALSRTLLMETKSIIGHAVYIIRNQNASEVQKDSAIDNLVSCMFAIEDYFVQGLKNDQAQTNDQNVSPATSEALEKPTAETH
ncbi:TPA: hypothetical protein ACRZ6V_001213 [Vibrio harveyi]